MGLIRLWYTYIHIYIYIHLYVSSIPVEIAVLVAWKSNSFGSYHHPSALALMLSATASVSECHVRRGYLLQNFNHTELPGFFLQETRFQLVFLLGVFFFRGNVGVERCIYWGLFLSYLQRFFRGKSWNQWTYSLGRWYNYLLLLNGVKFWVGENSSSWVPSVIATTFVHVNGVAYGFQCVFTCFPQLPVADWKCADPICIFIPIGSMYGIFAYIWLIFMQKYQLVDPFG